MKSEYESDLHLVTVDFLAYGLDVVRQWLGMYPDTKQKESKRIIETKTFYL